MLLARRSVRCISGHYRRFSTNLPLSSMVTQLTRTWSQEYMQQANNGDSKAMYWVGQMHLHGYGTISINKQQASYWLTEAIKRGDPEAGVVHNRLFGTSFAEPEKPDPDTSVFSCTALSFIQSQTATEVPLRKQVQSVSRQDETSATSSQRIQGLASPSRSPSPKKRPARKELPSDEQLRKMTPEEREKTLFSMFATPEFGKESEKLGKKELDKLGKNAKSLKAKSKK